MDSLVGVPFAVKANIFVTGMPATAGTPAVREAIPTKTASVVTRLTDAGAQVVESAGMHELALGTTSSNAAFGIIRNPVDPSRVAGGSSGGSAALVASGTYAFTLGTDTGGSMRIPAAYCGVVGFRPTTGRYPDDGMYLISPTRDTAGVFARNVSDVAVVDTAITGERELTSIAPGALRVGVPRGGFFDFLDDEVRSAMDNTLDALTRAGVTLVECDLVTPSGQSVHELAPSAGFSVVGYETVRHLTDRFALLAPPHNGLSFDDVAEHIASPDVRAVVDHMRTQPVTEDEYQGALAIRADIQRAYAECFETQHIDAIIYPTVGFVAPCIGVDAVTLGGVDMPLFPASIRNTDPGSLAGQPSISIPVPRPHGGLPVGLGIEGAVGADRLVLSVALTLEKALASVEDNRI